MLGSKGFEIDNFYTISVVSLILSCEFVLLGKPFLAWQHQRV